MKKHHILLLLLIAGIAAFFLNESRNLKGRESTAQAELTLLRDALKRSPGSTTSSSLPGKSTGSRPLLIDPKKFMADLAGMVKTGPGAESGERMKELAEKYEKQLASAPVSKLKEICDLLEKDFPLDKPGSELARLVWLGVLGMAAKSDPAWAFGKFDATASAAKASNDAALATFKRWAFMDGPTMNPAYAGALQKWLDDAQAAGRIEAGDPLVAELRSGIAAAQGNSSAAVQQISKLPYTSQKKAAIDYVAGLQTPEMQRQAMQELSSALHPQNFPGFVRELANQQGFEAARGILESVSLLPEKHDMAAAGIAAANIGSETKDRAAWLLENLKSDGHRALEEFTETWTEKNHADAAQWITTLQPGPKRDAALKGFIPTAARIDGATSMDWALTVSDPLLRNQMYAESYVKWSETDPEQANIYRNAHPLDHEALDAGSK